MVEASIVGCQPRKSYPSCGIGVGIAVSNSLAPAFSSMEVLPCISPNSPALNSIKKLLQCSQTAVNSMSSVTWCPWGLLGSHLTKLYLGAGVITGISPPSNTWLWRRCSFCRPTILPLPLILNVIWCTLWSVILSVITDSNWCPLLMPMPHMPNVTWPSWQ